MSEKTEKLIRKYSKNLNDWINEETGLHICFGGAIDLAFRNYTNELMVLLRLKVENKEDK